MVTRCQADFLPIYHEGGREGENHLITGGEVESLLGRQILGIFYYKNWLDDRIPLPASLFQDHGYVLRLIQFVKIFFNTKTSYKTSSYI